MFSKVFHGFFKLCQYITALRLDCSSQCICKLFWYMYVMVHAGITPDQELPVVKWVVTFFCFHITYWSTLQCVTNIILHSYSFIWCNQIQFKCCSQPQRLFWELPLTLQSETFQQCRPSCSGLVVTGVFTKQCRNWGRAGQMKRTLLKQWAD